jgi:hypothetical protein
MDQDQADREALILANEAGWAGLWEVLWSLNTSRPALPADRRERLAANALRRLRDLGYLTFARAPWPGPTDSYEYKSLTAEEVEAALESQGWRQVPPASDVWFTATAQGEAAFQTRSARGRRPEYAALALAAISATPVSQLLDKRSAIVLERLARGGGGTHWYYVTSPDRLADLSAELRPGSFVSFYFDDRITEGDPVTTRDLIAAIATLDGDAVVAAFDGDLELRIDLPAGKADLDDFLAALEPGDRFLYGAFPAAENDGRNAVSLVLPDADGVVREHPY